MQDSGPSPGTAGKQRVLMLGATGTIGRATVRALTANGHDVVAVVRPGSRLAPDAMASILPGATIRVADVRDRVSLARDGLAGEPFDALVSCLASRTGAPKDAWAIDHDAHVTALDVAADAGIRHMVLLSAICVQKPLLAFQKAKLAFEEKLIASPLTHSIVRPTAFFKSLSGQIERVRQGKPFLVFGDGRRTAAKPISDGDLGRYIARCLDDASLHDRILPIGGPGPAITPRDQGDLLFAALGKAPRFSHVPLALLDGIAGTLAVLGHVSPKLADKAELARIGRYYASESMLVLDPATGRYDADATPETGTETLFDFYKGVARGEITVDRGDHAVF